VGFKNFAMDNFGVVSIRLKAVAKKVSFPSVAVVNKLSEDNIIDFMGAKVKNLRTAGEQSATGMDRIRGVLVISVIKGSASSGSLQANDVILAFNGRPVNNLGDLQAARSATIGKNTELVIFRNQQQLKQRIELKTE
jgi:S1-C subfamily serine protease